MRKIILILSLTSTILFSCQKENKPINLQRALVDCLHQNENNYGVLLFGDSMLNFPSSHILSYLSSRTDTYSGLGNAFYPIKNDLVNSKGGFLKINSGAILYNVNQQQKYLGQPEWAGRIGYMNGKSQKVSFISFGVFPIATKTKIFILTDTTNTGTYDIQRTDDNGSTWSTVILNATTLDKIKGMKVHTFDDTSEKGRIGYRVMWKSGQIMCLDPLFLKKSNNHIYHITVGSGGADFKLQTSIPKERMRVSYRRN